MNTPPRPRGPHHLLAYALSFPERLLRAVAGLAGGLGRALSLLVPRPVRESRFYRTAVERQLKMMADDVGETGLYAGEPALDRRTAVRLGIGGTLDNLMVLGLHASPVWLLLAAADVTSGARAFVLDLGRELREAGYLKEGGRMDSVDDVLDGLSRLSNRMAETLDKPPLSLAEMRESVRTLRENVVEVGDTTIRETARLDELAGRIRGMASTSGRSVLEVAGGVAAGAMRSTTSLVGGTLHGAASAARIVGRHLWSGVVMDYAGTARRMHRLGFHRALLRFFRPHTRAWVRIFGYGYLTWTEIGLSLGRWRTAPWRRRRPAPLVSVAEEAEETAT